MKFDRKTFFDGFRRWRDSLTSQQVRGLEFLLTCVEQDPYVKRISWTAYMLATVMHETAFTFQPIHEYGSHNYFVNRYGGHTRKGRELGNDTPEEGFDYAGKGFPQTTGESNYEKSETALRREYPALVADFERRTGKRFDLTVGDQPNDKSDSQNMLDPQIAYAVMSYGMRTGMFTGRKLADYLNKNSKDYINARRIINGTDKAQTIAFYASQFETILNNSLIRELTPENIGERIEEIKHSTEPVTVATGNSPSHPLSNPSTQSVENPPNKPEDVQTVSADYLNAPHFTEGTRPQAVETTKTLVTDAQGNTQEINSAEQKNEQSVEKPAAIEEPQPQGVFTKLKVAVTTLFSGTAIYTIAERLGAVTFSQPTLILICFVIFIAFLGFCFWAALDAWKANNRVNYLVNSNAAKDRKDIYFYKPGDWRFAELSKSPESATDNSGKVLNLGG